MAHAPHRVVTRTRETAQQCAEDLTRELQGIDIVPLAPEEMEGAVSVADIVVCATTAESPVFGARPRDGAAIVAVGSHSPRQREIPGPLMKRGYVVVEDRATALREAGDIVLAIDDGLLTAEDIDADLGELVRGARVDGAGLAYSRAWEWRGRTRSWRMRSSRGPRGIAEAPAGCVRRIRWPPVSWQGLAKRDR